MQDNSEHVNPTRMRYVDEYEKLLIAELEYTSKGMQAAMQQFADARDRNMAARQQLAELLAGRAE